MVARESKHTDGLSSSDEEPCDSFNAQLFDRSIKILYLCGSIEEIKDMNTLYDVRMHIAKKKDVFMPCVILLSENGEVIKRELDHENLDERGFNPHRDPNLLRDLTKQTVSRPYDVDSLRTPLEERLRKLSYLSTVMDNSHTSESPQSGLCSIISKYLPFGEGIAQKPALNVPDVNNKNLSAASASEHIPKKHESFVSRQTQHDNCLSCKSKSLVYPYNGTLDALLKPTQVQDASVLDNKDHMTEDASIHNPILGEHDQNSLNDRDNIIENKDSQLSQGRGSVVGKENQVDLQSKKQMESASLHKIKKAGTSESFDSRRSTTFVPKIGSIISDNTPKSYLGTLDERGPVHNDDIVPESFHANKTVDELANDQQYQILGKMPSLMSTDSSNTNLKINLPPLSPSAKSTEVASFDKTPISCVTGPSTDTSLTKIFWKSKLKRRQECITLRQSLSPNIYCIVRDIPFPSEEGACEMWHDIISVHTNVKDRKMMERAFQQSGRLLTDLIEGMIEEELVSKLPNFDTIEFLLSFDRQLNLDGFFADGWTYLTRVLEYGKEHLCQQLVKARACVDGFNEYRKTPLMIAAMLGHTKIAQYLLDEKADPNIPNRAGETALIYAGERGRMEIVQALLNGGARACQKNRYNETAAIVAQDNGYHDVTKLIESFAEEELKKLEAEAAAKKIEEEAAKKKLEEETAKKVEADNAPEVQDIEEIYSDN